MYTLRKDSHILTKECTTNLPGQVMIFSAKKNKKSTIGTQSTRVITVTVKSLMKKKQNSFLNLKKNLVCLTSVYLSTVN